MLAGDVVRALYQHRVATTGQLQQLLVAHAADASCLRRVLRAAAAAGLVDAAAYGSAGHRVWYLTLGGYAAVEASGEVETRAHRMTPALVAGGLLAHRLAVVSTAGVAGRAVTTAPAGSRPFRALARVGARPTRAIIAIASAPCRTPVWLNPSATAAAPAARPKTHLRRSSQPVWRPEGASGDPATGLVCKWLLL